MPDLPSEAHEPEKPRFKRLVFCFDGTWNRLSADTPTNVVLTAASVQRLTDGGISQIIHYDEGVGTGTREKWSGGVFGAGLDVNLREAYRFLLFNYDPGDEIFVFGFSRGAFTARTFVGLLRHVGPLSRLHVGRIDEAIASYRNRLSKGARPDEELHRFRAEYAGGVCVSDADDAWRCANVEGYATGVAPMLKIKFLGLWDTVAAMGVPKIFPWSGWLNRKHHYHDTTIDGFVESVRHAVAIDERRATFPATLALGLDELNAARGFAPDDRKAPYQERWFPGVHGSIGGGGDIRGLSDGAMIWVLEGAKRAGLRLDTERGTRINGLAPDASAPLINVKGAKPATSNILKADRPGPKHAWQIHVSAQRRWAGATKAGSASIYKPKTLATAAGELDALALHPFVPPTDLIDVVIVKPKDTLSAMAQRFYGAASRYMEIYEANLDELSDPDALIPGQSIRIPRLAKATGVPPTVAGSEA